jgi:Zn-dependent M28 family amino/carboxypeptidase
LSQKLAPVSEWIGREFARGLVYSFGVTRAWLLVLVGCGNPPGGDDDPPPADTAPAESCTPLAECTWLEDYQRAIVGALAGATEIAPGVTLAHRESIAERSIARQYLLEQFTALGIPVTTHDYATGSNVIATLAPTGATGGTIIVGAHFDGVAAGPGAADNATGVAIVLATARYLRDVPVREHPIVFALFDEEERGLIGSRAYAASLVPTDIDAAHIFDMLSFDGDADRAVELWSPSATLLPIYQEHGALAAMPIQPVTFDRSDHQAFLEVDIPALGIGEEFESGDHTPHYHKATDTFDRVSFEHCGAVTHLAMSVLEASARTP